MDSTTIVSLSLSLVCILFGALLFIRQQNQEISALLERTSQKLDVSEEELRLVAKTFDSHEPIVIAGADFSILRVNRAYTQITGFSADEAVGRDFSFVSANDSVEERDKVVQELNASGRYSGEISGRRAAADGEVPMYLRMTAIRNTAGDITHYVAVYSDISEQKRNEEVINNLAFYDPLTGLPNRRKIMDSIERELYLAGRYNYSGALFFVDVDNFKNINDTMGHDHGDRLLIELGERLCSQVRKADTVSRLGGDEFLVLLQGEAANEEHTIDHATSIATKLLSFAEEQIGRAHV